MAQWVTVSQVGDPPPGEVKIVRPPGARLALANVDGDYFAIDDLCTHDGGPLGQGEVLDHEVECPRHVLPSLANHLHQHALRSVAVEFAVKNLLPRPEIQLALSYSDHHLASHDLPF